MVRVLQSAILAIVLLVQCLGCSSRTEPGTVPLAESVDAPVSANSGQPRLAAGGGDTVWLSWVEPTAGDTSALRYATLDDTGWSASRTVATGANWFVNWADLPSVRPLPNGRMAAHYLASNGPSALAYEVRITQAGPEGTWYDPVTPHDDDTATEHGFVSLLPWGSDALLAVWLDGRQMAGEGTGHQGEMTLRSAVLGPMGTVQRRDLIDERTCECCATSAVRVGDEALLAYRDRSEEEIRDIRFTRFDGEKWTEPAVLHSDGWRIEGCPVNGPALAARNDRVGAAWFTAANDTPQVKAAFSEDGGRTFSSPVVVSQGKTKGRVDVVLLDEGRALVSWLARNDGGIVQARIVRRGRPGGTVRTLARVSSAGRDAGFPKVVRSDDDAYVAWVEPGGKRDSSRVRVGRVSLDVFE